MFSLFLLFSSSSTYEKVNGSCLVIDGVPNYKVGIIPEGDAWAYWEDSLNETGWYQLHIKGNAASASENIMTCAGFLEGYLSHDRILNHFNLVFDINGWERTRTYPEKIKDYLQQNQDYIRQSVEAYRESTYWVEIGLILKQFDGLVAGYAQKDQELGLGTTMDAFDHWFLQSEGDMDDISAFFPDDPQPKQKVLPGEHCSGLIRILDDYSDIYFSHDAWSDFRELHGELKEYDLPIKEFKANRITFSTRIGKLSSYDDFYINDKGLFVLETTLTNFNDDLYNQCTPKSVFTWMRSVHATWTSESGQEWTETFAKHNSGTYNNQYLIIDSKKLTRGEKPTKDLLWIIEQMPGITKSADITDQLVNDGYFPSINTPSFEELFNLAHYPERIAEWGDDGNYWDYKTSSRYLIFAREAPYINDFDSFKKLMRYNRYQVDPYANGDPGQMILSRYDLRDLPNKDHFPRKMFGGLDTKALKLSEAITSMHFHGLASPECVYNPIFSFDDWPENKHDGLPSTWNHTWLEFESLRGDKCSVNKDKDSCFKQDGCGWCMYSTTCQSGYKDGPYMGKCQDGWSVYQPMQSWALPVIIAVSVIIVIFVVIIYVLAFFYKKQ